MAAPIMLVTGGSRGIGAATARLAAERGYDVALTYVSKPEGAEAVANDVRAMGRRLHHHQSRHGAGSRSAAHVHGDRCATRRA
ncbi:MAG: SDR family NAD(P)-dependent oxidoreductase [Alphaproteobacteria bacterium]